GFGLGTVTVTGDDPGIESTTSIANFITHTDVNFLEVAGSVGSIQSIDDDLTDGETPDLGSIAIGYWLGSEGGFDAMANGRWPSASNPTGGEGASLRDASIIAPGFDLAYDTDPMAVGNDLLIEGGAASVGFISLQGDWS